MKCNNCGKKINDDFNLCPYCGANISQNAKEEHTVFLLSEYKLTFSKELIEFNELRGEFSKKAEELENAFIKYYNSNPHSFYNLIENTLPKVAKQAYKIIQFGIEKLMQNGIDDIDSKELVEMVSERKTLTDYLEPILEKMDEIEIYAEELANEQYIRSLSRGHWQGGGFGLGGAIKGAITAGILNVGTNAFRSIGNSLSKASDKAKVKEKQEELAKAKSTFVCLCDTVYRYCFDVFYIVKTILEDENLIPIVRFERKSNTSRVNNYLSLYENNNSKNNYNQLMDALIDAIQACPYDLKFYIILNNVFKGNRDEILNLVKFFNIERNYRKTLEFDGDKKIYAISKMPEDTISQIESKLSALNKVISENNYVDAKSQVEKLQSKLQRINEFNSAENKIKGYCISLNTAIHSKDIEKIWQEADNGNVYAEEKLIEFYIKANEDLYGDELESIKFDLKKISENNFLAEFILAYINRKLNSSEIIKKIKIQNNTLDIKYVAPLYYLGYFSIKERAPYVGSFDFSKLGINKQTALNLVIKAANKLYPPALKFLSEYFRSFGNYDSEMSSHYTKCYQLYNSITVNRINYDELSKKTINKKSVPYDELSKKTTDKKSVSAKSKVQETKATPTLDLKTIERNNIIAMPASTHLEVLNKLFKIIEFSEKYNINEAKFQFTLLNILSQKCTKNNILSIIETLKRFDFEQYPLIDTSIKAFEFKSNYYKFEEQCNGFTIYCFSPKIIEIIKYARLGNPLAQQWLIDIICHQHFLINLKKQIVSDDKFEKQNAEKFIDEISNIISILFDKPEQYKFDLFIRMKFNYLYAESSQDYMQSIEIFSGDSSCPAGMYEYGKSLFESREIEQALNIISSAANLGYYKAVEFLHNYYSHKKRETDKELFYSILLSTNTKENIVYFYDSTKEDSRFLNNLKNINDIIDVQNPDLVENYKLFSTFLNNLFNRVKTDNQLKYNIGYRGDLNGKLQMKTAKMFVSVPRDEECIFSYDYTDSKKCIHTIVFTNKKIYWNIGNEKFCKAYCEPLLPMGCAPFDNNTDETTLLWQIYEIIYYSYKEYLPTLQTETIEKMAFCGNPLAICNLLSNNKYNLSDDKKEFWIQLKMKWEAQGKYFAVCPNCHEVRTKEDMFCPECGAKIY